MPLVLQCLVLDKDSVALVTNTSITGKYRNEYTLYSLSPSYQNIISRIKAPTLYSEHVGFITSHRQPTIDPEEGEMVVRNQILYHRNNWKNCPRTKNIIIWGIHCMPIIKHCSWWHFACVSSKQGQCRFINLNLTWGIWSKPGNCFARKWVSFTVRAQVKCEFICQILIELGSVQDQL